MKSLRHLLALLLAASATLAQASSNGVVISQVYGGGGNSGATLKNDFIELFNAGSVPVSLAGWSVQYASAAGTTWQVTNLGAATLAPGQRYLVQEAVGAGGTVNLPIPDATGTIAMSATAGKVALVSSTTPLTGAAPGGAALVDLVGFGTANAFEGAAAAPAPANATAVLRNAGGCSDIDSNANDFSVGAPNPRNSAAAATPCGVFAQPIVPNCPAATLASGSAASVLATATDADSIVNAVTVVGNLPPGFSLGAFAPATAVGGTASQSIAVSAGAAAGSYAITLQWANDAGQAASCMQSVTLSGLTPIYSIQGSGATSPLAGQAVTTRGVVTLVTNNGFFLQDPTGDGDPATSDGIFVFSGAAPTVGAGQLVQLSATVAEFNVGAAGNAETAARTLTELSAPAGITVLGSGLSVAPVVLTLPVASLDELERVEGMLVTLQGPLTVSQNFFLGRFGELTISAGGRLETPTNRHRPGADAAALADLNARSILLLDDGTSAQNPNPTPFLDAARTRRAGDTIVAITGVIDYGLATASNAGAGAYRVQPVQPPVFASGNPRTAAPEPTGGNIRVASANVLNFFTTFTDGTTASGQTGQGCSLGTSVAAANCRGADSLAEFQRQRAKIVEALAALDADVIGLMELQNNGATAVQNLVDALNAKLGAGMYQRVADPASGTGTDAIKVGMIFRPARVSPLGASLSDASPIHNRPPLAQAFGLANGERFAVVVNHFKSKGCDAAAGADLDQLDGQGCYNDRRRQQAAALVAFVGAVQSAAGTGDVLLVGDFNAYAKEDPIVDLAAGGFADQIARFTGFGYSYVFDGAAGRLDHALATPTLAAKLRGAVEWHINADEPSVLDYNLEFKQPACTACAPDEYTATPFRASDHDPLVVGLDLTKTIEGSAGRDTLVGTPGDDRIAGGEGADTLSGNGGRNVFVYRSLRDAADVITDFVPGTDRLDLAALLAAIGANPASVLSDGVLRIVAGSGGAQVMVDGDGAAGPAAPRLLVTLRGVAAAALVPTRDLVLR